ncbi:MAG: MATE family efflux transporter [Clostridiaceae bacterium]|jgi:putative MATE family efflux protein|nr:MATE family efflux transporter [Clostridiaceae bacterium]
MDSIKDNKMGSSPIFRLIITMSLPAMFSMLVQSLYNIVDSIFVSSLGQDALTALSLAFPVQTLMIAMAVGTSVGVNSLISRRLGEGRRDEANSAATHGLVLSIIYWLVFALLGIFFTRPFFESFSDNLVVVNMGTDYIQTVTLFSFGMFILIDVEKTLQATGNMIYPMIFQLTGAILNIILDPIMIYGLLGFPKMGVKGAAVATVTGQILSMLFCLYIMFTKSHAVHFKLKRFKFRGKTLKDIYKVGFPAIIMQSIMSFLTASLNAILIGFSEAAVAVLGAYYKLNSFVFMPVFGLMQGVMPIMGFNYGAGNKKRVTDTLKVGCLIAGIVLTLGTAIFFALPDRLLKIFNASEEMLQIGVPAFRIISITFVTAAISIMMSTLFQAVGNGLYSLVVSILRQLVIILPVAYFLSKIGLGYVWYAFPIADMVAFIVSLLLFRQMYAKNIKNLVPLASEV